MGNSPVRVESNKAYWLAAWRDPNGRVHRKSLGPKAKLTKTAAKHEAFKWAGEMAKRPGMIDLGDAPTVVDWFAQVIANKSEAQPGTLKELRLTLAKVAAHWGNDMLLQDVTPRHVTDFRVKLAASKMMRATKFGALYEIGGTPSTNTVRKHLRNLRHVFAQAVAQRVISHNPCLHEKCTCVRTAREWMEIGPAETAKLLEACTGPETRAMVGIARYAGLRSGEIIRLEWRDVDFAAGVITVRIPETLGGERIETTKFRQRTVPIDPALMPLLVAAHEAAAPGQKHAIELPGGEGRTRLANNAMKVIVRKSGLKYSKPFHTLRKCRESEWMARFPIPTVVSWMGHDPSVALVHYTRPPAAHFAKASERQTATDKDREIAELRARLAALEAKPTTVPQSEVSR